MYRNMLAFCGEKKKPARRAGGDLPEKRGRFTFCIKL